MDLDRIKRNVIRMRDQGAPDDELDEYVISEGATPEALLRAGPAALAPAVGQFGDPAQGQAPEASPPRQAPTQEPAAPGPPVSMAGDVAKSAGIGLARGGIGLATLPGNLEILGRLGINKLFGKDTVNSDSILPNASDLQGVIERLTGKFYEPKTTAGEYARSIGEFAPMAAFPVGGAGGLAAQTAARTTNVVAPALASETAGQLTEGTELEPWARLGGGLAGASLPNAIMRLRTPAAPRTPDPVRAQHIASLEKDGVTALTAGQRLGNKRIRGAEDATPVVPFAGQGVNRWTEEAADQFTEAALRYAGVQGQRRATPAIIDGAYATLGKELDTLARRSNILIDRKLTQDIGRSVDRYNNVTAQTNRPPLLDRLRAELTAKAGQPLPGEAFANWRRLLTDASRALRKNEKESTFAGAIDDVVDDLDDALGRYATPQTRDAWTTTRDHYRNLLAVTKAVNGAGSNTAMGIISPSQLRTAVLNQSPRSYARGRREIGELARAGEALLKPLPSSGTAERSQALKNFETLSKVGAVGGVSGIGLGAIDPLTVALATTAVALPGIASRGLMSQGFQRYLANERALPALLGYEAARPTGAFASTMRASAPLSGGIGPRYDENGNLRDRGAFR